jgi:hypothetical protein
MKSDLNDLKITDKELEQLTGIRNLRDDVDHVIQLFLVYEKSPDIFTRIPKENIAIRPSTLESPEFQARNFHILYQKKRNATGWMGKGLNKLTKTLEKKIKKYLKTLKPTPLGILLDEVDKYNRVLEEVAFVDQLEEAGNPVSIQNRGQIIETLQGIRAELIRALKTEKLFRENPHFTMQDFALDLFSWQRLELDEHAQKYEQFVNEALEIGIRVREDMKMWYLAENTGEITSQY